MEQKRAFRPHRLGCFLATVLIWLVNISAVAQKSNQGDIQLPAPAMSNLVVQWAPGSFGLDQAFLSQLNAKYNGRFQVFMNPGSSNSLTFRFSSGSLSDVDVLQVLRMEGVTNPWFARNSRRYFLTAEGTLASDIIK